MSTTIHMARRPSAVSFASASSSSGLPKLTPLSSLTQLSQPNKPSASPWLPSRSVSVNSKVDTWIEQNKEGNALDPDELFTKHTVTEVKAIQQRLRCEHCDSTL